jgi:signal transduction histidine kinase
MTAAPAADAAADPLREARVLVAEADETDRARMLDALRAAGCTVYGAADGLEALDSLDRLRPELLILDAAMPRVDGFAACIEARKRPHGAHPPVLMVTALDDAETIDRAVHAGATDLIAKPVDIPLLVHRARVMLRLGRMREELHAALAGAEGASLAHTDFLAAVGRELHAPLSGIIGYSEVLKRELLGPLGQDRYREYARDINESGTHLLALTNDILEFAKSGGGKLALVESEFDLGAVIASAIHQIAPRAEAAGVAIRREGGERSIRFRGDERKLGRAISNILSHAIRFANAGGTLRIECARDHRGDVLVRFLVGADAMAQRTPAKTPSALASAAKARVRPNEGWGLGIGLARAMIELHGGVLAADHASGAELTAVLPRERVLPGSLRLVASAH